MTNSTQCDGIDVMPTKWNIQRHQEADPQRHLRKLVKKAIGNLYLKHEEFSFIILKQ